MKEEKEAHNGFITLEDQAFLKALGISGMTPGAEYALNEHKAALDARAKIEARADGLLALELGEATKAELERRGKDPDELSFFRDVDKLPPE